MGEAYVYRPMKDQNGNIVGRARTKLRETLVVDVYVDEVGECWKPPTAWAYAQACRARQEKHEALTTAQAENEALKAELAAALAKVGKLREAGQTLISLLSDVHLHPVLSQETADELDEALGAMEATLAETQP